MKLFYVLLLIGVVAAVVLGGLFLFSGNWPPLVVIESGSMQHNNQTSSFGVADIGDVIIPQAISSPQEVITYVEGRATGYATFGDYGDVLLFRRLTDNRLIIHRPMFRLLWNDSVAGFDIPSLLNLERGVDWDASASSPLGLQSPDEVFIHNATFRDLSIEFFMSTFTSQVVSPRCTQENPCYVTMGDNNAPEYDRPLVRHSWVLGRARGELPWLGLLRLVLTGTYAIGDGRVAGNSWTSLGVLVLLLIGIPVAWDIFRIKVKQRRMPSEGEDQGGLTEVVSRLEERWRRRGSPEEQEREEAEEGTTPPED